MPGFKKLYLMFVLLACGWSPARALDYFGDELLGDTRIRLVELIRPASVVQVVKDELAQSTQRPRVQEKVAKETPNLCSLVWQKCVEYKKPIIIGLAVLGLGTVVYFGLSRVGQSAEQQRKQDGGTAGSNVGVKEAKADGSSGKRHIFVQHIREGLLEPLFVEDNKRFFVIVEGYKARKPELLTFQRLLEFCQSFDDGNVGYLQEVKDGDRADITVRIGQDGLRFLKYEKQKGLREALGSAAVSRH